MEKLKDEIRKLENELKNDENNKIIRYQLKGLYELQEEKKKNKIKNKNVTIGRLEKEKMELKKKKDDIKNNGGDIKEFLKIEKEIKLINNEIRDLKGDITYFTRLEFNRLKANIRKNQNKDDKYLLMILLAYEGALRVSEMINLKTSDIDFIEHKILCRRLKGSNTNTIILTEKTFKILEKYIRKNNINGLIFKNRKGEEYTQGSINSMFKLYCKKSMIDKNKQTFKTIKHTRAVDLGNDGLSLQQIQFMLGHKSINSTMVYFKFTTTQEENIYSKLSGY